MLKHKTYAAAAAAAALTALGGAVATAQTPSALPVVTITESPGAISVGGALQSGAVTIQTTTTGEKAGEPTLIRLNPGVTAAQLLAVLPKAQDPNMVAPYGSIVFDASAPKGTSTMDTTLAAGDYVALDSSNDNPLKWSSTSFTVAQAPTEAALPAPQATVAAIDFNFKTPKTLRNGELVRFQNDGWLVHMILAIRAKDKASATQIAGLLRAGKDRKVEKLARGAVDFAGPLSHGGLQQGRIVAKPGYYVLVCFMPTQDNREHTQLGMEKVIRIK